MRYSKKTRGQHEENSSAQKIIRDSKKRKKIVPKETDKFSGKFAYNFCFGNLKNELAALNAELKDPKTDNEKAIEIRKQLVKLNARIEHVKNIQKLD